ncbi:MAG: MarC family protein, partial [Crocosphaera sp.]
MNISDYINGFVALFAISNPIGNLPIYIGLTANRSKKQRQQTIRTASIA